MSVEHNMDTLDHLMAEVEHEMQSFRLYDDLRAQTIALYHAVALLNRVCAGLYVTLDQVKS